MVPLLTVTNLEYRQYQDFIFSQALLLKEGPLLPEDVFNADELTNWARRNGFIKPGQCDCSEGW